jgi:shikimate dehydrogenase
MAKYGLLGRNIDYSFSRGFFTEKFKREHRSDVYVNLDFPEVEDFISLLETQSDLKGFNVTIPYKESIIPYLSQIDPIAEAIGAVNTVVVKKNAGPKHKLIGYNTDHLGFRQSLEQWGFPAQKRALLLGSGGAAKAITFALQTSGFEILQVSRSPHSAAAMANGQVQIINYTELTPEHLQQYLLIVNCTPLGTFPNIEQAPDLPYEALGPDHYLYDLIYNPEETLFLKRGLAAGAKIKNGLQMLELQALAAWELWQK